MDFTINELSLIKLKSKEDAIKIFMEFSDVASALNSLGFRSIKIWNKSILNTFQFYDNFSLITWLKQPKYNNDKEKDRSSILKSLITKKDSIWNEEECTAIQNLPIIGIQYKDKQEVSEGLKIASLYNTIAISFNTDEFWNTSLLDLIYIVEDDNQNTFEQNDCVKHASQIIHIDFHKEILSNKFLRPDWCPSKELFPCLAFSNMFVDNDWKIFRASIKTNQQEKEAIIQKYGKIVAERNGYMKDKKISDLNTTKDKKRVVYSAGKGKSRIYLSVDLEKGGFEICNYSGNHLGEYFFDGKLITGKKSGHDLIVK